MKNLQTQLQDIIGSNDHIIIAYNDGSYEVIVNWLLAQYLYNDRENNTIVARYEQLDLSEIDNIEDIDEDFVEYIINNEESWHSV